MKHTKKTGEARGRDRGGRGMGSRGSMAARGRRGVRTRGGSIAARSGLRGVQTCGGSMAVHSDYRGVQTRGGSIAARGGRRGVQTRGGSMAAHSDCRGVQTRGGQRGGRYPSVRPSISEQVSFGMLENLPEGQPLETPIHAKRIFHVPKANNSRMTSSSVSPLSDHNTRSKFNYGSEEESEEEEESVTQTIVMPRVARMFMDEEDDEVQESCVISLEWPPPPLCLSVCLTMPASPTPASSMPASPTPASSTPASPTLASSTPASPTSASPTPASPTPASPTPASPTPASPTPASPTPASPTPASPTPASPTLASPTPASLTPASPTFASPTSASPTPASPTPVPPTMEPSDKFLFNWRPFPPLQVEPHLRREPFSQINSGPTVFFTNPYEVFTAIWDREIMELIVTETNIYAQQLATSMLENGTIFPNSRITRWQNTNVHELYTYFAIVLAMGIVVKSRMEEYWNTSKDIFSTPGFSTDMASDRFLLLSKCLHFNDNHNCDFALLTRAQAKLNKIQPILDHLNGKFSQLYNLSQNLALDESLVMWKGLLDINQFIPNKVATVGIKTYEICESQTGYLWRFEVHAGYENSAVQDDPLSGIVPTLVLRLLKGLEHKGHTVWMDNFYNSPALARELKVLGFDCVGTLRTNRQFVPSELGSTSINYMTVGQVFGCTSGDVDLMVWRDKKPVAFISTYHGLATAKCGGTLKPTVVQDYNICMGGVDRKDQLLAMYPVERKRTRVWYKKFFRRLLNISVLNAHILLQNHLMPHRKFRKVLITSLLSAHRTSAPLISKIAILHIPAQYDLIKLGKSDRRKRKCVVCTKRTTTYCKACQLAMCVFTCFEPYHT